MQRINSGAFTSTDTGTSNSGSINGVALSDPNGNELMAVAGGTSENVGFSVSVLGFSESTSISSPPIELSFAGNQANAAIACSGSSKGSPQFFASLVSGCADIYQTQPAPGTCPPPAQYSSPTSCATETPGNGKLDNDLAMAMDCKINNGTLSNNGTKCTPSGSCVNPNKWVAPNTISQILSQSPADPRLVQLIITNNGVLINGAAQVPVLAFATFYITGFSATTTGSMKDSDPCIGYAGTPATSTSLATTGDDNPGANAPPGILLGHFVQYTVQASPGQGGSGSCTQGAFTDCIAELTK